MNQQLTSYSTSKGSRVAVILFEEVKVFHRPNPSPDTDKGADFYGKNPQKLRKEFQISLNIFLDVCKEKGIEPTRDYSGKFNLRVSKKRHNQISVEAVSEGKSINQWVVDTLSQTIEHQL